MTPARILLLGASGGCGRWVARLAAGRGHRVTAVVRPGTPYDVPPGVSLRRGEVLDPPFLAEVLPGHDAVVSCLGLRRRGRSPWSALASPADLVLRAVSETTRLMRTCGLRRIVVVSAGGVGGSRAQASFLIRRAIRLGSLRVAYRDLGRMEGHLASTELAWHVVRPVTLRDGEPTGRAGPVARYGPFSTVRRADVADWVVRHLERPAEEPRAVLLGTVRGDPRAPSRG